ncbi:MAG: bifunctional phosphoglucose/phosphomannose isomerase [Aureispira sp.]
MMNVFIQEFPKQLKTAMEIGQQAKFTKHNVALHNIVVLGMGGSGIGGEFVAEFIQATCTVPMLSCKGYVLPAYVGANSLVIVSSYSGNTEETLGTFNEARKRGAKIVCISSGGKLVELAKELGLDYVQVPNSGQPPRTCLGYSLVQQLYILNFFGFAPNSCLEDLEKAIGLLEQNQTLIHTEAKQLTRQLEGRFPIIYATERMEAVALRFRQQLNENAKILCVHHVIPEMNHNELVGWTKQPGKYAVVIFRSEGDHSRNQRRIEINKEIMGEVAEAVLEINCLGDTLIEQALYGVHVGDWISYELSNARGVDSIEVNVIDLLKRELAAAALS